MGEVRRVIKRTVVKNGRKSTSTTSSSSSGTSKSNGRMGGLNSMLVAFIAIVLGPGAFFTKNAIESWQYRMQQSAFREQFNVTTIDNFLEPGSDLLNRLQDQELWRACDKLTASGYHRFWYFPTAAGEEDQPPNNVFEEMVLKVYRHTPYWEHAKSFEYWCNIMGKDKNEWPWHTDRDEDVLEHERKLVFPLMGAVFYGFNESYTGGEFHMVNAIPYEIGSNAIAYQPGDSCGDEFCVSNPHLLRDKTQALFVDTKFNMLLYANVTHFHKVSKLKSGRRYALAINANHWMPYDVKQAPTNEDMIVIANELKQNKPSQDPLHPNSHMDQ